MKHLRQFNFAIFQKNHENLTSPIAIKKGARFKERSVVNLYMQNINDHTKLELAFYLGDLEPWKNYLKTGWVENMASPKSQCH